jgi:gamma-glutamyltranspeptidase/glutathione hydrolase
MRDLQLPGRSPVVAAHAMVATSCVEASIAALDILRCGGNALDAAIAADAVLGVVEPQQTGIGGDVFALYAPHSKPVVGYNGSGRAPAAATSDEFASRSIASIATESPHAVTIPGAVDAWVRLNHDWGTKPLAELLAPAVTLADGGFPVSQRVAHDWAQQSHRLQHDRAAAAAMLPGGSAPTLGDTFRHPALAATLRDIGRRGRDAFYTGDAAAAMAGHLRDLGGLHTADDFAATRGEYVEPIGGAVGHHTLLECPPNTQGFVPLLMLEILRGFDVAAMPAHGAQRLHLELEAGRLAVELRDRLLADTRASKAAVEALLAPKVVAELRAQIDPRRAAARTTHAPATKPALQPVAQNTVYICVVDRDRNVASFISSIYHFFGSGLYCAETGVLFHSRGSGFSLDPAHPNCIAPRKRPKHTIIPALLCEGERPVLPFGVVGGDFQPYGQTRLLVNVLACGMDIQQAIDAPRAFCNDGVVDLERGFDDGVRRELEAMGHVVRWPELPIGGAQGIWIDHRRGVLIGGSDARKDGCVLGC